MAGWAQAAMMTAQAAMPLVKAGLAYKPSKQEKMYLESLESQAGRFNQGTAQGEGVRQQQLATGRGQAESLTQQQQAEISRGGQGNLATSGQQGQALLDTYAQKSGTQAQVVSDVNVRDSAMMKDAYAQYQQGLQQAAAMEYARRMAAMGEADKLSYDQIVAATEAGQQAKVDNAGQIGKGADYVAPEVGKSATPPPTSTPTGP